MLDAFRLYLRYIGISIHAQMQYRASFILLSAGLFLATGVEFVGVCALFDRFGSLREWHLSEVALFYGMVNMSMAVAKATTRGFDKFGDLVKAGDFDRLLLRPRSTPLQLIGREIQLIRVGRFLQGLAVLLWAMAESGATASPARLVLAAAAVLGGACTFAGLFVLKAVLSFWTVETLELTNSLTYGGVEAARYPLTIYRPWFRRLFTYIVPLAFVTYFPGLAILGRPDPLGFPPLLQWTAPLAGMAFLLLALQVWRFGVRHYRSTGS